MHAARQISAIGFALVLAIACASTKVTDRQTVATGNLPRPDRIWVYDFGASAGDVPDESALAGRYDAAPMSAEDLAKGRAVGAEVARALVSELQGLELPAQHASVQSRPRIDDIVIRGYFASIHEGSAAERMVVGFGAGASKLTTVVECFQVTPQGLRKLAGRRTSRS